MTFKHSYLQNKLSSTETEMQKMMELMCHFLVRSAFHWVWDTELIINLFSLLITNPYFISSSCGDVLERYCFYLVKNRLGYRMTDLDASTFTAYLSQINEVLVRRGPVTFEIFTGIVTKPLIWERYSRPVWQQKAKDQSPTWSYNISISKNVFPIPTLLFYDFIPFSYKSFSHDDFHNRHMLLTPSSSTQDELNDYWAKIRNWLAELNHNSIMLHGDRPGTDLHQVLEWWRNFVPNPIPDPPTPPLPRSERFSYALSALNMQSYIRMIAYCTHQRATPPSECRLYKHSLRENEINDTPQPWIENEPFLHGLECDPAVLKTSVAKGELLPLSPPPLSSHTCASNPRPQETEYFAKVILDKHKADIFSSVTSHCDANDEENGSQTEGERLRNPGVPGTQDTLETELTSFVVKDRVIIGTDNDEEACSDSGFDRKAVATEGRVSRSFSLLDSDKDQPSERVESLQPPRKKKQMINDSSDTDSVMTEVVNGPPDSSYEDDMSDEDFWSAKSTAELSLASLD